MLEFSVACDSNPGVAAHLLGSKSTLTSELTTDCSTGLTVQQAQALGLHIKQTSTSSNNPLVGGVHPLWYLIPASHNSRSIS